MDEKKIIYPELSFQIVGCLFEVFKKIGFGYREKHYQKAIAQELTQQNIKFQEQFPIKLIYKESKIGQNFFDFLIEDKIVLEIKVGNFFLKNNLDQILGYLKVSNKKLGILANFTREGVKFYRVLNIY